jgi:phospholipase C
VLRGAGLAGLSIAGGSALNAASPAGAAAPSALPAPAKSGIEHVVVLMMENRSFDHFLGWLPGATGKQAGLTYRDINGVAHQTHHLTTYQGCDFDDPDHSVEGGRRQFDFGHCDGWLRTPGLTDTFPIGHYKAGDLPFIANAARTFTTCDQYFSALLGPTFPNRFYMHAAQTDRLTNTFDVSALPTIWDRCAAAGVSHNYHFSDVPIAALWGTTYLPITQP